MRHVMFRVVTGVCVSALAAACGTDHPADRAGEPPAPGTSAPTKLVKSELGRDRNVQVSADDLTAVVDSDTAFALDVFRAVAGGDRNAFISPYSIASALAMSLPGARGETAAQIAHALRTAV